MSNLEMKVNALIELALATDELSRQSAISAIKYLACEREMPAANNTPSVQECVEKMLDELGAPCNLLGYDYILTATCMVVEDPMVRKCFVSLVYPKVGEQYGTTASRVERAIRTAVLSTINKGNANAVRKYFGSIISPYSGGVTNSAFICRLAREVERKMQLTKRGESNEVD